ncbi:MAG: cytochrome P450, partial [Chloroflexi bacterium]|nr:cytochrome P450 [Chloroflexota bacterium]
VPGLPVFGNALALGRDMNQFLVESYHRFGPIYRMQIFNRDITVLAGMDANTLVKEEDENIFTNEHQFAWIREHIGKVLTGTTPEEHAHMRRQLKPGYSRVNAGRQLPLLVKVIDDFIDGLQVGDSFEVFPTMQTLVLDQLGYLMVGSSPEDYLPDFRRFMKMLLQVHQLSTRPAWVLRLPAFQRAKARSFEMAQRILDEHKQTTPGVDRPENAIDILLNNLDVYGNPYDDSSLLAEAMGPFLAGQDTVAGTLSFLCYTMHKHADVHARVAAEARAKFSPEMSMNQLRELDDIHKTIIETMRRYTVGALMPRHARKTFEFAGHRVDAGAEVYSATAVVHFLPENYAAPWDFNIDRPAGPSGAFVPYGVGNYACLGAGIADIQLLVTMAALLRRGRFELDPADYKMKIQNIPLPNPGPYRLKLVEKYD